LILEIKSVYQDRDEHEKQQADARTEQISQFGRIAERIDKSIQTGDQHFQETVHLASEQFDVTMGKTNALLRSAKQLSQTAARGLDAVTGGKSFPYFRATYFSDDPTHLGLTVELSNSKDVGEVKYEIAKLAPAKTVLQASSCRFDPVFEEVYPVGESGPIQPGLQGAFLPLKLTPSPERTTQYRMLTDAKNGRFVQCLDVRPSQCGQLWEHRSVVWLGNYVYVAEKWPECSKPQ
jgi:hypothetical protein